MPLLPRTCDLPGASRCSLYVPRCGCPCCCRCSRRWGAAATPLSPVPGSSSLHPVFPWRVPSNERSRGLFIADSPDLAPDGRFLDEGVITSAEFANDERQWSPGALYAGHYWWLVWSSDRTTSQSYYSAPAAFTVPVSLRLLPVKT